MALPAVTFGLLILAVMAATAGFVALQEWRTGRNALAVMQAQEDARGAIHQVLGGWNPLLASGLQPGQKATAGGVEVRRLTGALLELEAGGTALAGAVERRLALLLRLDPPRLRRAALTVEVQPASGVVTGTGLDIAPTGWLCASPGDSIATLWHDHAATDSLGRNWNWLRLQNWAQHGWQVDSFRLVGSAGDLSLVGGRHIGVLVVGGDLRLSASAEVKGVVIVRGRIVAEGLGGAIVGAVASGGVELGAGAATGALRVEFSSCVAEAVLRMLAPPRPVQGRALRVVR